MERGITELSREELIARIQELEQENARKDALIPILYDNNPDAITIIEASGTIKMNDRALQIFGEDAGQDTPEEYAAKHGFFFADKVTPFPLEEMPGFVAFNTGKPVDETILYVVNDVKPEGAFVSLAARPLPGGGSITVIRDITEKRRMEEEIARRTEELAARELENRELIARLRVAVDELSTPVLEIWDEVLALPVIGVVDTQRSAQMTERLLAAVVASRARDVIVDLTGVELIDTSTADRLLKLARAVQLLGARCIVTGIQPAVAQTLVELGVDFGVLETRRNLKHALQACIRRDAASSKA
jgi:rsbT co-antagonist protein RsbR